MSPSLIWGPTDATAKLSQLIQSARHSIDATTELLNDPYLEGQLIAAAHRGVQVRLIDPHVPREGKPNTPQVAFLNSQGVDVRVTTERPPPGRIALHACQDDGRRRPDAPTSGRSTSTRRRRARTGSRGSCSAVPFLSANSALNSQSDWMRAVAPLDGRSS